MGLFLRAAVLAALCFFMTGLAAVAQDVQLRSFDGTVELSGTLIGFDGEFYRIDSIYGPLSVSAEGVSCRGPGCPNLESYVAELRLAGAPFIAEQILPVMIERFAAARGMRVRRQILADDRTLFALERNEDETLAARFYVTRSTTADGLVALETRDTDIALAVRALTDAERSAAEAADQGDLSMLARSRVIGLDALVPLVAPGNAIDALSLDALARLFAGEITNWQDLGGPDAPIALHLMAADLGAAQDFLMRVMTPREAQPAPQVIRHDDATDLADAVARDPFAIGMGSFSRPGNARIVPLEGACGFVQPATASSLKSEDYPLTAPLVAYLPLRRMPQLVREFLRFFEGEEADRVLRRVGVVNQRITRLPLSRQGDRLANAIAAAGDQISLNDLQELVGAMAGAERLSPTFRFQEGTTALDAQSASAISRLARAIERGALDGRELVFVGFSDGQGGADANLRLSLGRAEAARLALIEAASDGDLNRVRLQVLGFGEALPMACDDSAAGRAVNRRVEVWLR